MPAQGLGDVAELDELAALPQLLPQKMQGPAGGEDDHLVARLQESPDEDQVAGGVTEPPVVHREKDPLCGHCAPVPVGIPAQPTRGGGEAVGYSVIDRAAREAGVGAEGHKCAAMPAASRPCSASSSSRSP